MVSLHRTVLAPRLAYVYVNNPIVAAQSQTKSRKPKIAQYSTEHTYSIRYIVMLPGSALSISMKDAFSMSHEAATVKAHKRNKQFVGNDSMLRLYGNIIVYVVAAAVSMRFEIQKRRFHS